MKKLFNPAIALMNRLSYPRKFVLISLLLIVPLALVMTFFTLTINSSIEVAQQEIDGDAYLRPLHKLLQHTLDEKELTNEYLSGNFSLRETIVNNQSQIDKDFEELRAIDQHFGGELKTTEQLRTLEASWRALKDRLFTGSMRSSEDFHTKLIADIRAMISLVGDTSNLILDPDLDSYYTMDSVLLKLPEAQDLLARTRFLGDRIIGQQGLSDGDRTQFIILSGLVQSNMNATKHGMEVAFRANPAVRSALETPLQEYTVAVEAYLHRIDKEIIFARSLSIRPEEYIAASAQSLDKSFNFWDRSVGTLDDLLRGRIDRFNRQKYLSVAVVGLGLALVIYFCAGFYLSVMRTVSKLDEASKRMISGDMVEVVRLDNRDELGRVARSFNEVATAMIAASAYRQAVVDNAVDGIITIDEQGVVNSFNPAAARIFGYSAAEVIDHDIAMLIPAPHDREYQVVGVGREVVGRRKDETTFPLDLAVGEMRLGDRHAFIAIVHDITERKRAEQERVRLQAEIIQAQAATLAELSTPLIPISDEVLVMPLIGAIDQERAQQVLQALLHGIEHSQARVAILDITGVPVVDTQVASALVQAAQGVRLLGAQVVLTGIRPEVAQTLVGLGVDISSIVTHGTLQSGIAYATNGH